MIRAGDQVELIGPVFEFKIHRGLEGRTLIGKDTKELKRDGFYVHYDKYATYVGAVGIAGLVHNNRVTVTWTHYMPGLKPPLNVLKADSLLLLHRPDYPNPESFNGREKKVWSAWAVSE